MHSLFVRLVSWLLQVFAGNSNTYIAELREINPPIIARRIRLIPHSSHPRTICLRLELYGCLWRGSFSQSIASVFNGFRVSSLCYYIWLHFSHCV